MRKGEKAREKLRERETERERDRDRERERFRQILLPIEGQPALTTALALL